MWGDSIGDRQKIEIDQRRMKQNPADGTSFGASELICRERIIDGFVSLIRLSDVAVKNNCLEEYV